PPRPLARPGDRSDRAGWHLDPARGGRARPGGSGRTYTFQLGDAPHENADLAISSVASSPILRLLKDPAVPIRIAESGKRRVVTPRRIPTGHVVPRWEAIEHAADIMEDAADVDATLEEFRARLFDVAHGNMQPLDRAGRSRRDALPKGDRGAGIRKREADDPKVVTRGIVELLAEPGRSVEHLCTFDLRHGNHDEFEFHVQMTHSRPLGRR